MTDAVLRDKVEELIRENPVLLFMKGTPDAPRCGFSMRVVQVLGELNVEYGAIDVLSDLELLREATGETSDWRTFPSSTSTASWSAAPTSSRRCSPRASWPDCSAWSSPRASSSRPRRPRARRGRARRLGSRTDPGRS